LLLEHRNTLKVEVSEDNKAAGRWETLGGGEYYAAGVGGSIPGRRADLAIIDDPIRSREDAESSKVRDGQWDWYQFDLLPRLKPGAAVVLITTRWFFDDLAGRILEAEGAGWDVVSLPMEAGANDVLGRRPGEMLWPEWFTADMVAGAKRDTRVWSALYQQEPAPETGDYFRAEWLRVIDVLPARDALHVYGASDYAVTSKGGDWTVHVVVGVGSDDRMYVLDLWRGQSDSSEWIEAWCDLVKKWRPREWAEEGGQINAAVGPFLERRARERQAYTFRRQFPSRHDKSVRAQSIRGRMATLGLYLPKSAAWRVDLEAELLRFPAGRHDDQVDSLSLVGQLLDTIRAPDAAQDNVKEVDFKGYSSFGASKKPKMLSALTL
jgi:predicted phage terminase large subunit-like protein